MADVLVRGQIAPAAGVWGRLFEADNPTVISTIHCCNIGSELDEVDVRIALEGAEETDAQYILKNARLPPGLPFAMTEGFTLLATDYVEVRSSRGSVAFNISGVETT